MIFTGELNYFVRLETGLSINYKFTSVLQNIVENKVVYIKIIWSQLTTYPKFSLGDWLKIKLATSEVYLFNINSVKLN